MQSLAMNKKTVGVTILIFSVSQFVIADNIDRRLEQLEGVVTKQLVSIDNFQKQVRELKNENQRLKVNQASMESKIDEHEMRMAQLEKELQNNCPEYLDPDQEGGFKEDEHPSKKGDLKMLGTANIRSINQKANVAFHSSMSRAQYSQHHEICLFDVEEVDVGNGYNSHDGIYVVPVTGLYVFTFTIPAGQRYYTRPELVVNGSVKGPTISDSDGSGDDHPTTVIILVSVTAGDRVFVRTQNENTCHILSDDSHGKSTFSGWLLF